MGEPKLLLPWPLAIEANAPSALSRPAQTGLPIATRLIDSILHAWTSSRVIEVLMVIRRDDDELLRAIKDWNVSVVRPEIPSRDMKESIQHGLVHLQQRKLAPNDCCFIAPADLAGLTSSMINRLIDVEGDESTIVVPSYGGRPGHPSRLPWGLTNEIFRLGEDEGLNRMIERHCRLEIEFPAELRPRDLDTPAEYEVALQSEIERRADSD
jgi:molybdenum cofactor cytidylyltransferase